MSDPVDPPPERRLEDLVSGSTAELSEWRWLWEGDREFPLRSHRGALGRLVVALKRLLRPLVKAPQSDLWDRQRVFNLALLSHLERLDAVAARLREHFEELGRELQQVQGEILRDLRAFQADYQRDVGDHAERLEHLELFKKRGVDDIARHHDALFARLDQKLDRIRRQLAELGPEPPAAE